MFFTLFGAVAVVGVLGAGIMATMRGPLSTMVDVNRIEQAKSEMRVGLGILLQDAVGNDPDSDGMTEPVAPEACSDVSGMGGACVPMGVGSPKSDPWGNSYMYCAWNNGSDADASGTVLAGGATTTNIAVAMMSSGPDGTFNNDCEASPDYVDSQSELAGDDIIVSMTYNEAIAGSGGLWTAATDADSDPEAEIDRHVDLTKPVVGSSLGSAQLRLGAASMLLPTDSELENCTASNKDLIRINKSVTPHSIENCYWDGTSGEWVSGGGLWTENSGDEIYFNSSGTTEVGIGTDSPTETLHVAGTGLVTGDVTVGEDLIATGDVSGASGTFSGALSGGTLNIGSGSFQVNADGDITAARNGTFSGDLSAVDGSFSGYVSITGDNGSGVGLAVTNAADIDGALDVAGNSDLHGDLNVGDSAGNPTFTIVGATGNTDIGGTLDVTGATTLDSTLRVLGNINVGTSGSETLTIDASNGNTDIGGTLNVDGMTTVDDLQWDDSGTTKDLTPDEKCNSGEFIIWTGSSWDCRDVVNWDDDDDTVDPVAIALSDLSDVDDNLPTTNDYCLVYDTVDKWTAKPCNEQGIWEDSGSVILISDSGSYAGDDFVFGSDRLEEYTDDDTRDNRFFFDKSKSAFRAGSADTDEWNDANVGNGSIGLGINVEASGANSFVAGYNTTATGIASIAMGYQAVAGDGTPGSGDYSMALGLGDPSGSRPTVTGDSSLGIFMGDQSGYDLDTSNVMALVGGHLMLDDAGSTPATRGCLRYNNDKLQYSDNCSDWYSFTDDISGLWTDLGGGRIHYGTSSSNQVGVGTNNPQTTLDVNGGIRVGRVTGAAPAFMGLDDLGDVSAASPSDQDCIVYNDGTSTWESGSCTASIDTTKIIDDNGDTQIQVEEGDNDDTIRFDTNGDERMQITSAGNVGIGDFSSDDVDSILHLQTGEIRIDGGAGNEAGCIRYDDTTNDQLEFSNDCSTNWTALGGSGAELWTDNDEYITRGSFHILNTGETSDSAALSDNGGHAGGKRAFYDPDSGALRGGEVVSGNNAWDDANIGTNSFAWGYNAEADGANSVALGYSVYATEDSSFVAGRQSQSSGGRSIAMGFAAFATGGHSIAIGTGVGAGGSNSVSLGEQANASGNNSMAIGLGEDSNSSGGDNPEVSAANSLGIFMGDNDGYDLTATNTMALVGGQLMIDGDGGTTAEKGCIRYEDTTNNRLEFSNDCSTNWTALGGGSGSSLWTDNDDYISRENFHILDAGLAAGSTTAGLDGDGTYAFYDPDKGAMRGGTIGGGNAAWQDTNIGNNSFVWGERTEASGNGAIGFGQNNTSTGSRSFVTGAQSRSSGSASFAAGYAVQATNSGAMALGVGVHATNYASIAMGNDVIASGSRSMAFGAGYDIDSSGGGKATVSGDYSVGFFIGDNDGYDLTATNTMALVGGVLMIDGDGGASAEKGCIRYEDTTNNRLEFSNDCSTNWTALGSGGSASVINDLTDAYTDYANDNMYVGQGTGTTNGTVTNYSDNVGFGINVMTNMGTGCAAESSWKCSKNVAFGIETMDKATTAVSNIAIGWRALDEIDDDIGNIGIGENALGSLTAGQHNTVIGARSTTSMSSGSYNVIMGTDTAPDLTSGSSNLILGEGAAYVMTSGSNNVFLGRDAADTQTEGSGNIVIGQNQQLSDLAGSNQLNIGGLIYGDLANSEVFLGAPAAAPADGDLANGQVTFWVDATNDEIELKAKDSAGDLINVTVGSGSGSTYWTDNTTHLSRQGFHIINTGQTSDSTSLSDAGGSGRRAFYDTDTGAMRGGGISNSSWDDGNIGDKSFAWGTNARASGTDSIALGNGVVSSNGGIATGTNTTASGEDATAMGWNSTASGQTSFAFGPVPTASGRFSIALMNRVQATAESSMAVGLTTYANNPSTHPQVSANESIGFFFGDQDGYNLNTTNRFGIVGGTLMLDDATGGSQGCIRFVEGTGLQYADDCSSYSTFGGGGAINGLSDGLTDYASNNMYVGDGAGGSNGTITNYTANMGVGQNALTNMGTGCAALNSWDCSYNTAVGFKAMEETTTGGNNTALGFYALRSYVSGFGNVAIGDSALRDLPGDGQNVAIGSRVARNMTAGSGNVLIGADLALDNLTTANYNTIIGATAATAMTNASNNTIIGRNAGNTITTGGSNIMVGTGTNPPTATTSSYLNIGNSIYGDLANDYIGIGEDAPDVALDVAGDIEYTGTITDVSDKRLKDNIVPMDGILERIAQLDAYSFTMKGDERARVEFGVMAQDLEAVFPELVHTAKDEMGTKSVNYIGLIAPMIEATKELKAENDALRAEISEIKTAQSRTNDVLADLGSQVELLNKIASANNTSKASMESVLMLLLGLMGGSALVFFIQRRKA